MARFLFVVPPATGHVNPTISVAAELRARGHEAAWVGFADHLRRVLPADAEVFGLEGELPPGHMETLRERAMKVRGAAAFQLLWEDFFFPLARAMWRPLVSVVEAWRPDALAVDQQTFAGALVARRQGLPWATLSTTSASVADPMALFPKVRAWFDGRVAELQREAELEPRQDGEISPHRVIVFSTPALVGPLDLPAHYSFVGPSIAARPQETPFPWEALREDVPKVLVSLGTVNAARGARFYREMVEAVRGEAVQAVFAAPPELVTDAPDNVLVQGFVPQLALLPRMDAVVCHAGHNTVVESLACGLPLVVAPIKDDQPAVAAQVVAAGAGVRVKFGRSKAATLREAMWTALRSSSHREAARRIQASFAQAGGAARAAELLEELT